MRNPSPRSLDALVAHQVRRWEFEEAHRGVERPAPCVALSRLPGSGGAELGRQVAEALGFGFFGIELVDQIAREVGVQRELVQNLDEHVRLAIERWVIDGVHARPFSENHYRQGLLRTLGTLREGGLAVILGRGSAYVLPPAHTLRVLVVASRPFRRKRRSDALGIDPESADLRLAEEERERRSFIDYHFHVDPDDPSLYDLVVNTETLGVAKAARLVVEAARDRFPELNQRAAQRRSVRVSPTGSALVAR